MVDVKTIIKRLKEKTNVETNKALCEKMGINPNQVNVWLNKNSINYHIVIDYCDRNGISLDWLFLDKKYEISDNIYDNEILVDHIVISLKRIKRIDRSNLLNYFIPTAEFITRYLKKIDTNFVEDLSIYNAREKMIDFLQKVELNRFLDTEIKRHKIIEEIKKEFSSIECYVMLKYPHYFV